MAKRKVARLHLRSTVEDVDHVAIEDWCLRDGAGGNGWAGVGWGLWDAARAGIGWEQYCRDYVAAGYELNDSVKRLYELPIGSLVWTRRRDSSYWLGELTGPWEYRDGGVAQALDMFNVRRCHWWKVGTQDSVPGIVVSNFNRSKTLNPVADYGAVRYTLRLHAQVAGHAEEIGPSDPREVVESLLGALDLEDLVAVYLQDRHSFVLVNRGKSSVGYEYVLRRRDTGRRAVATVKSAGAVIDLDALPDDADVEVWAFAVSGRTTGQQRENIRWISTDELIDFIRERESVLPDQVARWLR
jgi:hypothetical protein